MALYVEFLAGEPGESGSMFPRAMELTRREVLWSADDMVSPPTVVDAIVHHEGADCTVHGRQLYGGDEVFRLGE